MRAIDADALKKYITSACEDIKHLFNDNGIVAKLITESFCKDIDEQPTIEPERKKGHWLLFGDSYMEFCKCSNCGHSEDSRKNFCPECGADMRGGQDEWVLRG